MSADVHTMEHLVGPPHLLSKHHRLPLLPPTNIEIVDNIEVVLYMSADVQVMEHLAILVELQTS
jgi:hypothetical protein